MSNKICKKCGESKAVENFGKQAKSKDGLKNYCKECIAEINKERYIKNKDKYIAKVREWQKNNKKKVNLYKKRYARRKREEDQKNDIRNS